MPQGRNIFLSLPQPSTAWLVWHLAGCCWFPCPFNPSILSPSWLFLVWISHQWKLTVVGVHSFFCTNQMCKWYRKGLIISWCWSFIFFLNHLDPRKHHIIHIVSGNASMGREQTASCISCIFQATLFGLLAFKPHIAWFMISTPLAYAHTGLAWCKSYMR